MMAATEWKRCSPGEWEGREGEIVAHITERICRDGESIFAVSVSAPWLNPAIVLLGNRHSLAGAMNEFEDWIDSTAIKKGEAS